MADIKTKSSKKGTIKTINKQLVGMQRVKDRLVETKEKIQENTEQAEDNGTNYAINKISNTSQKVPYKMEQLNRYGKNNIKQTKENIIKANEKVKYIRKVASPYVQVALQPHESRKLNLVVPEKSFDFSYTIKNFEGF